MSRTKEKAEIVPVIVNIDDIVKLIYTIRGEKVMLDSDLAALYGYEVKRLNEQVKRNIDRFPDDFMFQLTKDELSLCSKSQIATLNESGNYRGSNIKKMPFVFTEQGCNMQFVTKDELHLITDKISEKQQNTDRQIDEIKESIDKINENFILDTELKNFVIYKGQKFEADKAYIDIYRKAKKSIYVIDDYVNIKTLEHLAQKKAGISVILFTENKRGVGGFLTKSEVTDFNTEFSILIIKPNPECHDRFIILDYGTKMEKVFHCGASSKDAGNKVCAINEMRNTELIHPIIAKLLLNPDKVL